jgi:hypothetical protein
MKIRLALAAALLCALPAQGGNTTLSPGVINALTPIDTLPSKSSLNTVFQTQEKALDNLQTIALDSAVDLGIELRAIRSLPAYCPPAPQVCGPGSVAHDTLIALIDRYSSPPTAQDQLRLRAAIEALGAAHSGLSGDVDKLLPLLSSGSRDVRNTVVRALCNIGNSQALAALDQRYQQEATAQVRLAISAAVKNLGHCN